MRQLDEVLERIYERYDALEAEGQTPLRLRPCKECLHGVVQYHDHHCTHPLVRGYDPYKPNVDWHIAHDIWPSKNWPSVELCGIEKLLWEPIARPVIKSKWKRDPYYRVALPMGFIAWLIVVIVAY